MKLSFFSVLLLLAAGSNAGVAGRKYRRDCAKRDVPAGTEAKPAGGDTAQPLILAAKQEAPPSTPGDADTGNPDAGTPGTGTPSKLQAVPITDKSGLSTTNLTKPNGQTSSGCPGFRNVVFNTAARTNPGFPAKTWPSIQRMGVDNWIGFSLETLDNSTNYGPIPATDSKILDPHQIRMVMDREDVGYGLSVLKDQTPEYLALFNEPDHNFLGYTLTATPAEAFAQLKPFYETPHPGTQYLSPGCAVDLPWLEEFQAACMAGGIDCMAQTSIISYHIYNTKAEEVMSGLKKLHNAFSKPIWITELAPSSTGDCGGLDETGTIQWMKDVYKGIQELNRQWGPDKGVQKIFWNCGEAGKGENGLAAGSCNPSLTTSDGNPTALGNAYANLCEVADAPQTQTS